ncbi:MAG: DUF4932 domain-containing protein [Breznakibacter sp.]
MSFLKNKILFSILLMLMTMDLFAQNAIKNVDLTVNKNFELFYAMYLSSNVDSMIIANKYSGFPLTTQLDFELKRSYYSNFSKYKDSPQVRFYYDIASQGFLFSAPFNALLRADSNLQIIDSCYFKQLPIPPKARESVVEFIGKLREFRDLSKFNDFFTQNKPQYDTIINIHKEKADLNKLVFLIEDFFGSSLNGYHVILSPMMWPGGVSLTYMENCADSLQDIYVCIGPKSISSDIPVFGSDDEFKSTIVHEFVHPFIMKYCTKYQDQIQKYAHLYNKDREVYQNNGCPDWFSAINELLTRTVEIIINSNGDYQGAIKAIDYQSKNLGFSYIPVLYSAFDKYYSTNMRKASDFDLVFLNVLHSLEE